MESRDHAKLGPSAAHRWLTCPASIRVAESLEAAGGDTGSTYAAEGTAAHTVAEIVASEAFGLITPAMATAGMAAWRGSNDGAAWTPEDQNILEVQAEMIEHARLYVEVIQRNLHPQGSIHLELKVDPDVRSVWGTGDCVLIDPEWVTIIDYKYGTGVRVDAYGNEQLMFYALGAVEADLIGSATMIRMVICQPRLDHVSTWEIPIAQLLNWRDEVARPGAELALSDDAPFGPSEKACQFCPARGRCKAQMEWVADRDFAPEAIDLMDTADYAEALRILPAVRAWCTKVEEVALEQAYSHDAKIPGWKVVLSGGKRIIPDPDAAITKLVEAGYPRDKVERTKTEIETLGNLDKVVKVGRKKVLAHVLGDLLTMSEGRPSLVPESDGRPVHSKTDAAFDDFAEPLDD